MALVTCFFRRRFARGAGSVRTGVVLGRVMPKHALGGRRMSSVESLSAPGLAALVGDAGVWVAESVCTLFLHPFESAA
jgi:hypothetical protein